MENREQLSFMDGFKLFVLLMIFMELGAVISSLTFNKTIFIFNSAVSVIGLGIYLLFFSTINSTINKWVRSKK